MCSHPHRTAREAAARMVGSAAVYREALPPLGWSADLAINRPQSAFVVAQGQFQLALIGYDRASFGGASKRTS